MKLKNYLAVLVSFSMIVFMAGLSMAQERKWEDAAELSYVQTGGNTDVLTFSGNNSLKYAFTENWTSTWDVGLLYGKTDGVKNAERYFTDLRTDYKASGSLYYYALGGWEQDQFSGIDKRLYLGPGMGYKILTGEKHFLSTEAGINYATETYTDGSDHRFMEGRALGEYEYVFNAKTKFSQTAEYLHNFDDAEKFRINTVSSLITQLTDMFSLKVNYEIKYQNQPSPETLKKTDTLFSVALVVNF
jgi:putative salt-induced outer membrane protein